VTFHAHPSSSPLLLSSFLPLLSPLLQLSSTTTWASASRCGLVKLAHQEEKQWRRPRRHGLPLELEARQGWGRVDAPTAGASFQISGGDASEWQFCSPGML
jgi:hypothetical protein